MLRRTCDGGGGDGSGCCPSRVVRSKSLAEDYKPWEEKLCGVTTETSARIKRKPHCFSFLICLLPRRSVLKSDSTRNKDSHFASSRTERLFERGKRHISGRFVRLFTFARVTLPCGLCVLLCHHDYYRHKRLISVEHEFAEINEQNTTFSNAS